MFFSITTLAVLGLACSSSAHMTINTPVPYGKSTLNNSPLNADGSDFPCKLRDGVYKLEDAVNVMPIGSTQSLKFTGSAVHGGGSCQISITYDQAPTKDSVWKVIHSIEGGCPAKGQEGNLPENANGNGANTYSFQIPDGTPTGTATLAWTWFNKVGNREMYMNCAPISITAGSSKRSEEEDLISRNVTQLMERDQNFFNALPNMFTANINNDCKSVDSADLAFPNPGNSLEKFGLATGTPVLATGGGCAKSAPGGSNPTSAPSAPSVSQAPKPTTAPASLPGGVFLTVPAGSAPASATPAPNAPTSADAPPASLPTAEAPSPAAPSAPSSGSGSGSGVNTPGTACSNDGQWNCIGGNSYQRCGSGLWTVVQPVADGTQCTIGTSDAIIISAKISKTRKRNVRFSQDHIHRHAAKLI